MSRDLQNSYSSGHNAAKQALEKSGQSTADIAVVLASSLYNQEEMLKGVRDALGGAPVVGCSSAGTITDSGAEEQAVSTERLGPFKSSMYDTRFDAMLSACPVLVCMSSS